MPQIDILLKSAADTGGFDKTSAKARELQTIFDRWGNSVFVPVTGGLQNIQRQSRETGNEWDRLKRKLEQKFSGPDFLKDLLRLGGLGSGFAVAETVIGAIKDHFREIAEAEQKIVESTKKLHELATDVRRGRMTPAELNAEDQAALEKTRARVRELQNIEGGNVKIRRDAQVTMNGVIPAYEETLNLTVEEKRELAEKLDLLTKLSAELEKNRKLSAESALTGFFAPLDAKQKENEAADKAAEEAMKEHTRKVEEELQFRQKIMDGAAKAEARSVEMAKNEAEKVQREKATAALRAARDEVQSYDIALSNLAANPYLTDAEKEPKRIALIDQQTAAIARLRKELEQLAQENPEVAAMIGGEVQSLGEKASRNEGASIPRASAIERARTGYRASQQDGFQSLGEGVEGGLLATMTRLGTVFDQIAAGIENTIGAAVDGITQGIMNWDGTARGAWQAIGQIGRSVLQSFLQTLVQMGVQWAVNAIVAKGTLFGIEATADTLRAARVAKENAAEASTLPAKTAGAAASGISSFGAALVFGALAVALIASLAGGFAEGGYTAPGGKHQPAGVVHAGEWVAPQWLVNHPTAGPLISALEGMRTGAQGFSLGGFFKENLFYGVPKAFVSKAARDYNPFEGRKFYGEAKTETYSFDAATQDWVDSMAQSGGVDRLTRPYQAPESSGSSSSGVGSIGSLGSSRPHQVVYVDHRDSNALAQLESDPRFETTVVHIMRKNRRALGVTL